MIEERVLEVVKRAVAESLAVPAAEITLESRLIDDLGADSLDFVDIVFMLDRELDIRVRETEFNLRRRLTTPTASSTGSLISVSISDGAAPVYSVRTVSVG